MPSATLIAGTVMDAVASLMNDTAKSVYTYTVQIPYLNMALLELREYFELNDIPVTSIRSSAISIPAGYSTIAFGAVVPAPALPTDLVEPQQLWERTHNTDPYIPMTRVETLPLSQSGTQIGQFIYYVWKAQKIEFFAANQWNDIKIDYIGEIFTPATGSSSAINVINTQSFLDYRTAALCAKYIGENESRSNELNNSAQVALDRVVGIGSKGRQSIVTRRKPFRAGFRVRGGGTR